MNFSILKRVRAQLTHPRRVLMVASTAAIAVVASTTVTFAAWTDNEWVNSTVGAAAPGDCTTNTLFQNRAWGRQLTGTVLNTNLDSLAGVNGVTVTNDGTTATPTPNDATVTQVDATTYIARLPVSVLNATVVAPALGLGVPVGGLGTYTQWAQSGNDGKAHGASGLVSDQSGAIDATGTANGATTAPKAASVNLDNLVPGALAGVSLNVGAVAASSQLDACVMVNGWPQLAANPVATRDYGIASLDLNANVPAVGALSTGGATLVNAVPAQLNALLGTGGLTTGITNGLSSIVNGVGGLGIGTITTTTTLSAPDLTAVSALMTESMTDPEGVLTVNLASGTVRINIASLVSGTNGLNSLGPNHEVVLDAAIVNTLTAKLTALLDSWKNRVVASLTAALRAVTLTSTTDIGLVSLLGLNPLATIKVKVGPTSLGQFLDGTAPSPVVTSGVLGLDLLGLVQALVTPITTALLSGTNGVVATVLGTTVFGPAGLVQTLGASLQALIAPVVTAVGAILTPFSDLVSIRVNVQPDQAWTGTKPADVTALADEYKVSAIRVGLINSAGLLSLSLANASAGPAALRP